MDPYSDSGELYQLRQQFFAAQYGELAKTNLEDLIFSNDENKYRAIQLQIRSLLALGKFDAAKAEIAKVSAEAPFDEEFKALEAYTGFLEGGKTKSESFEAIISANAENELVNLLGGLYYVSLDELDTAISLLSSSEGFENISLLVYVHLLLNKTKDAAKILSNFSQISQDNQVFTLSQSWYDLIGYEEPLKSAYYFYDEFSSNENTVSVKNLLCLFISNLKLLHFPESQDILNKIEEQGDEGVAQWKADLLINRISFEILQGNDYTELVSELKKLDPSSSYLADLKEKDQLFDSIVENSSSGISSSVIFLGFFTVSDALTFGILISSIPRWNLALMASSLTSGNDGSLMTLSNEPNRCSETRTMFELLTVASSERYLLVTSPLTTSSDEVGWNSMSTNSLDTPGRAKATILVFGFASLRICPIGSAGGFGVCSGSDLAAGSAGSAGRVTMAGNSCATGLACFLAKYGPNRSSSLYWVSPSSAGSSSSSSYSWYCS
ncbi:hypothetical protein OGAPHI_000738 [Ogataea philodendri]|uniref:Coatomer subunit epsilon n=1 Tax=Ogataea philodendri TaxID=1378263 RepID=A0A9P8PFD3_9ASCO|nr:uncharacterized protein OGAPHI_000738 [Ogataea philodendri]KAH3671027.1 hypothetical protein OGAPHI_000738 [Ogataea philodendri]